MVVRRYLSRWVKSHSGVFNYLKVKYNCIARRITKYLICYRCEVLSNIRKAIKQISRSSFWSEIKLYSAFNSTPTEFAFACKCKEERLSDFVLSFADYAIQEKSADYLTRGFHIKFHLKNRYHFHCFAICTLPVFRVKIPLSE